MEKTIEQASIFKEELTEILIDGEDTVPVSDIDYFYSFVLDDVQRSGVCGSVQLLYGYMHCRGV